MEVLLSAHKDYWDLSDEEKKDICNGCGAKGAWYNFLIPSGAFDVACNIHDYDYFVGNTQDDKRKADRRFINNMNRIVSATKSKPLRVYRAIKAKGFYTSVKKLGDAAYWKDKVVDKKNSISKKVTI